ncbi:quercetin 2,3-dioxygenase [Streptomyces sp. CA-181903]|uniref:quercetin 2,3-dioxygenase n=1 Tax=Streptomyces sp. CA-181903 TaxID=3240055 RepID=UPI003D94ED03
MTIEYATRYRKASHIPAEPGTPYFTEKAEGDRAHLFGDLITVYTGGEQTENTFDFFTVEGPKSDLIPALVHADTYEVFHVTAGAVRLFVEDTGGRQQEKLLTPGDFGARVPHGAAPQPGRRRHRRPPGHVRAVLRTPRRPADGLGLPREPVGPEPGKFATVPGQYDVHFLPDHRWTTG